MKINIRTVRALYAKLKPEIERVTGYSLPYDGQESPFIFKLATGKLKDSTFGLCKGDFVENEKTGDLFLSDTVIKLSNVGEPSEESARSTMAHEIIHLIEYMYFKDQCLAASYDPHGKWFLQMARKINDALGTNIMAYVNADNADGQPLQDSKARVIMVGMKVLNPKLVKDESVGKIYYFKPSSATVEKSMIAKLKSNPWAGFQYTGLVVMETDDDDVKELPGRKTLNHMMCSPTSNRMQHKATVETFGYTLAPGYSADDEEQMLSCFD